MPTRRESLGLGLSILCGLAGCTGPADTGSQDSTSTDDPTATDTTPTETDATPRETDGLPVRLETVTDQPVSPLAFAETSGGQYYVADRPGQIYVLDGNSTEPALDLSDVIVTGGERGLLGLALHPNFNSNGRLYVRYSASPRSNTPDSYSHTFVLAEFRVESDGRIARDSERTLLEIPEPQSNHNSGPIAFGPDGYLYVGVGDGGGGGDRGTGHVDDWYDANEGGNGQDVTENLLGSLLRIDVDDQSGGRPYGIPDDNPLVGREGLDEHYAWGLRNPWGISFDGADLYVADVGQSQFEEVNRIERGGNYGWNVREGSHCYGAEECPETTPDGEPLRDPVVEYPHDGGEITGDAVVGGYVYRGSEMSALSGRYVFGDLSANGRLFVATPTDDERWSVDALALAESSRDKLDTLLMMGRDRGGELYALSPSGVHRLVAAD